jgi:hypothetical protein
MIAESLDFEQALEALGELLEHRCETFELVIAGGGALAMLGHIVRSTKDIDIVALSRNGRFESAKTLPPELIRARDDVASHLGLAADWLNAGPAELLDHGFPAGFEGRMITRRFRGLTVHLAGRFDQICFKFYAAVDRGPRSKHVDDLRRLTPTREELFAAASWARGHDPSPEFRELSRQALDFLGAEDGSAKG